MANTSAALLALAEPTRRVLLERLARGPRTVGALAEGLPMTRSAVSQHLKVLKDAGLVADRPEGTRRIYRIDPQGLGPLRAWLDQFWNDALAAYAAEFDQSDDQKEDHT